jgi:hypothetical protein
MNVHKNARLTPLTMRQHHGDNVGIVDLTTSKTVIPTQRAGLFANRRAVLQHTEAGREGRRIR